MIAGLAGGAVSGLVRPDVRAGVLLAQVLGAGFLFSGLHWMAVSRWREVRRQIARPGGFGV